MKLYYITLKNNTDEARYFIDTAGWVSQYTGKEIRTRQTVASQV